MKNYFKSSVLLLGVAAGVSLYSCKKDKKKENESAEVASNEPTSYTYYNITDLYPGTSVIEVDNSASKATVHMTKDETKKAEPKGDKSDKVVADVPVEGGNLIYDEDNNNELVGGYVSLNFKNVMTSPTGNQVGDVEVVTGNLVADESDGIMDVHIESVDQLDEVVVKDGIENTHMMKGKVRMNGKRQDFEVPVNINQVNDKMELVGLVDFDRSNFYSDDAFSKLSAEDLMNDHVKVRVRINSKGTAGKISIYDADKDIKEKVKWREHSDEMTSKLKEKGDGFKDKDKIMEKHDKELDKMKEKSNGDVDKEKIRQLNDRTIEKLTHRQKKLEKHKERLKMQQERVMEKYKDKDKQDGEKEKIVIDQKMDEIDAKIKEIDDQKNHLRATGESTDGGLNNPNPASDQKDAE